MTTSDNEIFDIAVIGGGINGAGIAADAAGRGLKVVLCEQNDFASGTSSNSSKLIHGGLRYLEHFEFRLVREALAERELLLKKAPHLIRPLKFTLPHRPHLRPAWLIRSGLLLYDFLYPRSSFARAKRVQLGKAQGLRPEIDTGFEYYDCWVDDARLVISNLIQAHALGADIRAHTRCHALRFDKTKHAWELGLCQGQKVDSQKIWARNVVNATGPWLDEFLRANANEIPKNRGIRLIKGSHIIVPRITHGDSAFILQNKDKRIVFVLPYLDAFSLIGTTDEEYQGPPDQVEICQWEIDYLLDIYNQHFEQSLSESDIISSYSGLRPLCDDESGDPSAITRDYTLDLHQQSTRSAVLSIYGGKITTYRKLAEAALDMLSPYLPKTTHWTDHRPLPGTAYLGQNIEQIKETIWAQAIWLPSEMLERFAHSYGLLCLVFIADCVDLAELGEIFGADLSRAEVDYLLEHEWAQSADDILWRRTKLGLKFSAQEREALQSYIDKKLIQHQHHRHLTQLT